jgi:DNA polymerase-3 subunit gamma/tau
VKFIFATTEIRKVPITVLSRCQRFDLRRIEADTLAEFYGEIAGKENAQADEEALNLIARAADGSVRDGLSLLDQAIALGDGAVTGTQVKEMLGLADRAMILDVLEHIMKGNPADALNVMEDLYKKGADPAVVIQDLLDITHMLTKHRALPQNKDMSLMPEGEQKRLEDLADSLSMPTLGRTWQILLKGLTEVNNAPNPQKAAEMVIIRLIYAAYLPDPADLVKKLKAGGSTVATGTPANAPSGGGAANTASLSTNNTPTTLPVQNEQGQNTAIKAQANTAEKFDGVPEIKTMGDVVQALEKSGEMVFATQVRMFVHPVKITDGAIEFRPANGAPERLSQDLSQKLKAATGNRWVVSISNQPGEPTLAQLADKEEENLRAHILEQPLVKNIINLFPDAQLKDIIKK